MYSTFFREQFTMKKIFLFSTTLCCLCVIFVSVVYSINWLDRTGAHPVSQVAEIIGKCEATDMVFANTIQSALALEKMFSDSVPQDQKQNISYNEFLFNRLLLVENIRLDSNAMMSGVANTAENSSFNFVKEKAREQQMKSLLGSITGNNMDFSKHLEYEVSKCMTRFPTRLIEDQ